MEVMVLVVGIVVVAGRAGTVDPAQQARSHELVQRVVDGRPGELGKLRGDARVDLVGAEMTRCRIVERGEDGPPLGGDSQPVLAEPGGCFRCRSGVHAGDCR
jgi:hypothetical protein